MKATPRRKSEPFLNPSEAAEICYRPYSFDIFQHADFVRRWFGVVDMRKMKNLHGNSLVSTGGETFSFYRANFYNFKNCPETYKEQPQYLVKCEETCEVWILQREWLRGLAARAEQQKETNQFNSYREILNYLSLVYINGEDFKKYVESHKLYETPKNYVYEYKF